MKQNIQLSITGLSLISFLLLGAGCTTTKSTQAAPLKPVRGVGVDLRTYEVATVVPFVFTGDSSKDPGVSSRFATDIAYRLKLDFGQLFKEVRIKDAPVGEMNELVVTGDIQKYKPGSRLGRAMLIGVTPASFEADLILKDGVSGRELLAAPIDKLWAWGGIMGASKGIEEMLAESAAAAARTVAEAKGWSQSVKSK